MFYIDTVFSTQLECAFIYNTCIYFLASQSAVQSENTLKKLNKQ